MTLPADYNILMYSHDTYGLGHIRRTMAIASHLQDANTNILILTGSPIAGRFAFPEQVDFVRIPGMIKKTNDEYRSLSIRIDATHALKIRTDIIKATAKTFQPDLFIVDKEPLGLKREVLPTLKWLKRNCPDTKAILGLRDVLDESSVVCADWRKKGVYRYLDSLYDEIWVYGDQDIYDPIKQYKLPENIQHKVVFTGYISRNQIDMETGRKIRKQFRIFDDETFILVTTGGGGDGSEVLENYLDLHDKFPESLPFKSVVITGPFMPRKTREQLRKRARRYGIKLLPFHPHLEELMKAADLVISMGGYNTVCEILTQRTPALIIPRESPRQEQLIRAERMRARGLIDYIPWTQVTPTLLREKIVSLISRSTTYIENMEGFSLSGLETMRKRLNVFKKEKSISQKP
ncbi:MAG TPA: glycosyltransferase [Desulfopila sp.]|nr:glycosyltransferase [Desulfopila sp.]